MKAALAMYESLLVFSVRVPTSKTFVDFKSKIAQRHLQTYGTPLDTEAVEPLYSICLHQNQVAVKLNEKLLTNIGIFKKSGKNKSVDEWWELEYFCSEVKDKIICLICNNAISVPKLYNIKRHYEQHKSKYDTYEGLMRQEKLKEFKLGMKKQQFMFTKVSQESEAAVNASYVLSEMIANTQNLLLKCEDVSSNIFVSNTVVERVTDMARNLNDQIKEKSSCFEAFSIACDEITDIGGVPQLAVFFSSLRHGFQHF
ncbi:hypothetical protein LAZ67_9001308 [Cordylochernes scorpioides]|uniref:SPIN-DOC-like zinc-finger domain-containing protein n=1 Tax=Cordylochernes scorpioides TaxID=51811 RepID=A0ABY6KW94_9ARAC|nr:hypothetical protein LAZ67_9001308 [Cordylochernes scorpioides]